MLDALTRRWLLKTRIYDAGAGPAPDPHSLAHLYLVQQRKRLSLSASAGRIRPGNLLLLPVIVPIVFAKAVDLWIANQIVRAMINERELARLMTTDG